MIDLNQSGYSSRVELALYRNGTAYSLAQVGSDHGILRKAAVLPSGEAEVEVTVDGDARRSRVFIAEQQNDDPLKIHWKRLP